MTAKTIAFRVDASFAMGTGHVMRCLALAEGLKSDGVDIVFVCRKHTGHMLGVIESRGFRTIGLQAPTTNWTATGAQPAHAQWLGVDWQTDADDTIAALDCMRLDWLIVDHYALDARWEQRVAGLASRIAVIDDLADRPHACHILIDQNLVSGTRERYMELVPEGAALLLGPYYALLQPDYRHFRADARPRGGSIRRILVSFGGVDSLGLTAMAVDALLAEHNGELEVDIVLSAQAPDYVRIEQKIVGLAHFRLHDRVPSLAGLMLRADLMIGAGGTTSWERLCLGLPAVVITMAENQRPIAEELARRGLVRWLGDASQATVTMLRTELAALFRHGLDANWSEKCLSIVDGRGVERVSTVLGANRDMPIVIRNAMADDEALLLEWANDPQTRQNAFNPQAISAQAHHDWFTKRLNRPDHCVLFIAETESGIPIGQIRFEREGLEWEISYALAPMFRGVGLGRPMLDRAIQHLRGQRPVISLLGQVKIDNPASSKIFTALGFRRRQASPDRYIFERSFRE